MVLQLFSKPLIDLEIPLLHRKSGDIHQKLGRSPTLVAVLIGNFAPSEIYVSKKTLFAEKVGIASKTLRFSSSISQAEIIAEIEKLNLDSTVDGILVQQPLPKHLDLYEINHAISPSKDIDGFTPENIGLLSLGKPSLVPCTAAGVVHLLDFYRTPLKERMDLDVGVNALVIGRSMIVGKPVSQLLMQRNHTVTQAHSKTRNMEQLMREADLVVLATGSPTFKSSMFKDNAVIVDVGITRTAEGVVRGDLDPDDSKEHLSAYTPVPKGIGPMTILELMKNTIIACENRNFGKSKTHGS